MGASERTTIKLPALDSPRPDDPVLEVLEAERTGVNSYRLVHTPGLVDGLAAGDEIELVPTEPCGFRVLERGGNLCVWFHFATREEVHGPAQDKLRRGVEALGGYLDGGTELSLIFTIPLRVGFEAVEAFFEKAKQEIGGSAWMYGNVYDPKDDRPLNWWLEGVP